MDLKTLHHFLLLGNSAHEFGEIFGLHVGGVGLAAVDDVFYLSVHVVKSLQKMHVSQLDPLLISISESDSFVFNFDVAFSIDAVFDVHRICLVEEVVHHWRHQVKSTVANQQATSRLLDPI